MLQDDFVYSFLLGSRLFLSPHQLLTELHRLANENTTSDLQLNLTVKTCLKCRQMQSGCADVNSAAKTKGTDFRSHKFPSAVSTDSNANDDAVRRRPRGRRLSRDSGILSGILETLQIDNSAASLFNHLQANCNDSGLIIDEVDSSCSGCLKLVQREACFKSKHQMLLILRDWVKHFPADFRNKRTMWTLNDVIKNCQIDNEVSMMS